jgi:ankyrin repeat protein
MLSSTHLARQTLSNASFDNQPSQDSAQIISGKGETTCFTPPQTGPLLALPTEILVYLLQYLRDAATPLLLSTTCHQLRSIYQDEKLYTVQDRQLHRFIYTLNTPALYDALHAKLPNKELNIKLPDPHTADWEVLKDQPLPAKLGQKRQVLFVQKTYLIAWELLLQAEEKEFKDKAYILKLMQIVGKLSSHIDNVASYTEKLFNNMFPTLWLEKLIAINLDWGLQLICGHFAWRDVEPLVTKLDPALSTILNNARYKAREWQFTASCLTGKPYASFLPYVLEHFYLFGSHANVEFTHPDIKALLENILADPESNYNIEDEESRTLLIVACQNNREALVSRYLKHLNVDTNQQTSTGLTALDCAVENEAVAIIQALLTYGVAETTHIKAFNYAIELQKGRIAHTLWQRAADKRSFIEQALGHAITAGKAEVAYQLIKQCPQASPPNYSLLSVALKAHHLLLVDWLLCKPELKFDINSKSDQTLLHDAIILRKYSPKKLTALIKHLLESGADCNAINDGYTPLMLACERGQEEIVALLLQQPTIDVNVHGPRTEFFGEGEYDIEEYEKIALRYAVWKGINIVKLLLTHEINVADRVLAFTLALGRNKEEIATLLLQSAQEQQGFIDQALTQAITDNVGRVVYKLIKDYKGNPNTTDEAGSSALTVALEHQYPLLFDLLLNHPDFVINIGKDKQGKTVLQRIFSARELGQEFSDEQFTQLATLFIEQGGNYNLTDEEGNTPLMLACKDNREAVMSLLLQQPYLDINIKNKRGDSALQYAVIHGSVSMVQALLKYEIEQDDLVAAFYYAMTAKKEEMIDVLRQAYSSQDLLNQVLSWTLQRAEKISYAGDSYPFLIQQLIKEGGDPNALARFYPAVFNIVLRGSIKQLELGPNSMLVRSETQIEKSMGRLDQLLQMPELTLSVEKDYFGNTPLHYAVQLDRGYSYEKTAELISHLFKLGVDGNAVNKAGNTALMLACQHYPALALLLLQQPGMNINIKNASGYSAVDLTIQKNNRPLLETLLKHDINPGGLVNAFNYALFLNKKKITTRLRQALEDKGIEVNQIFRQALADTKFYYASSGPLLVELIDEYDADPDTVDEYGNTVLNKALKEKYHALIDKVLERPTFKVNVTTRDQIIGNTALLHAIELNYPEEKKLLLVKRLLEYGADCNARNERGETPLIVACEYEQEKLVHVLLQQPSIDMKVRNESNKSVLDYAVKHGMTSVVQVLLNHSLPADHYFSAFSQAIISQRNDILNLLWQKVEDRQAFINQALSWIIKDWKNKEELLKDWEKVEELLSVIYILIKEYDADPNTVDKAGHPLLAFTLLKNDITLLDMLLAHPKLRINMQAKDEEERTLLHLAISLKKYPIEKHLALIERLLKVGADCNATAKEGWTPLMALAQYDKKQLLPLLLQYGPDSNAKTTQGCSALDEAVCCASNSFVTTLLKYGVNTDTLLNAFSTALQFKKGEMISLLWPEVQRQEDFTHRTLSFAISQNYAEAVYQLIKKYRADPNTVNKGFSVLNVALQAKHIPLLDMLLSCSDCKVSLDKDSGGNTALLYALALDVYAEEKRLPLIDYLLKSGADYDFVNNDGCTPLMLSCSTNQFELTKLLLQYAPNINARNQEGSSALDEAVIHGTEKLVQALLAYEVDDDTLVTAFNQAIALDRDNMADILLRHADRSDNGLFIHQALARAIDKGQQKVISILRRKYGAV